MEIKTDSALVCHTLKRICNPLVNIPIIIHHILICVAAEIAVKATCFHVRWAILSATDNDYFMDICVICIIVDRNTVIRISNPCQIKVFHCNFVYFTNYTLGYFFVYITRLFACCACYRCAVFFASNNNTCM